MTLAILSSGPQSSSTRVRLGVERAEGVVTVPRTSFSLSSVSSALMCLMST